MKTASSLPSSLVASSSLAAGHGKTASLILKSHVTSQPLSPPAAKKGGKIHQDVSPSGWDP